jgi:type I restriction enzyme S subunit
MEEWKSYSLPDIARFSQGKQVPLEDQYEICKPGFDRFVRIVDYTSGGVQTPRYVSCDDKYRAEASDIIMIRYGTPGRVYRGIEGIIANNMFKIIPNEDIVSKQFLFWYLSDDSIYQQLLASQSSTTMPAIAFGNLKNIIVNVPPKKTQERIVSILNKLDDKIHNNNRINHNLAA